MPGSPPAFTRPVTLRRSLACDLVEVRPAVQSILEFLAEQHWDENDLRYFDLALVEACNNAIEYAAGPAKPAPITLEVLSDAAQVEFRIHDHTTGFDWPEKIELPPPESESGRGLHLITSRMDYAGYFRGRGENILVLRKNRPASVNTGRASVPASPDVSLPSSASPDKIIADMVEELSSCYESLSAIFRYSAELGKAAGLNEFSARLLRDLLRIVSADWFVLRIVPRGESRLAVFAASEPASELPGLLLSGASTASLELDAARTRQAVWFDAQKPIPAGDPLSVAHVSSAGLVHPIILGEQLIGTLALGRKMHVAGSPFTAAQTNVVNTFADFLAIQIANAHFHEEQLHQRLVSHELVIAANIQRSLLPASLPQLPGFTLAAFCHSAHEVGGDFYDAIQINEHSALLVIADVMGKGVPAAMFAAVLRALLRASPEITHQPAALLTRVNSLLYHELSDVDMFITAQLAFVDAQARRLTAASAGHCPLALVANGTVKTFSPEGMPLGLKPNTVFEDESAPLPDNCRLLMYSDGLTEAFDAAKKPFGHQRLYTWLARDPGTKIAAQQLKDSLVAELNAHQSDAALKDDQTFIILAAGR